MIPGRSTIKDMKWLARATAIALRQPKFSRGVNDVLEEYSPSWESYARRLDDCETLSEWLCIPGLEDQARYCNFKGQLRFQSFDSNDYNRGVIFGKLQSEFPHAQSVTEYGCGLGRNLLYLKHRMPHLELYGYELCQPGVDIANKAAKKFGLDVHYRQLDYVLAPASEFSFPATDLSFTMFSLEQIPTANKTAVENILAHSKHASMHLEPVPENYPYTLRGLIGRLDHYKANYLRDFDRNVRSLGMVSVSNERVTSAHNPLMFPSIYVLRKR